MTLESRVTYMPATAQTSTSSLSSNVKYIEEALFNTNDLKQRTLRGPNTSGTLLYLESLVDPMLIERNIIIPFKHQEDKELDELFTTLEYEQQTDLSKGVDGLIQGSCVYFQEGKPEFYILAAPAKYDRSITEPENEGIIRGPHNGFIESLTVNLYLIRKAINASDLIVKYYTLGSTAPRRVALIYLHSLAQPETVQKVESRLESISIDSVISTGFLQENMEDNPYSIFPQHLNTERPDHASSYLLTGKIAILLEGDPTALIVPASFFAFYQTPDDYNNRWIIASFVRIIRLISFITAFQLPAIYIATVSFHSNVLPLQLFFTVQGSLTRVPFPPLVEAMLLELIFELLREAGLRLPSRVGQTIGIVGGLVIGDAIVKAGLVSYTMIIVVALTAISSFLIPSNEMSSSMRILRFPLMVMASMFGFIGISFGLTIMFIHLCKLESFGKPYFSPLAPLKFKKLKDTFVRFPIWNLWKNSDSPGKGN
ncbi:spore germination protein [Paenibacillus sp. J22TS3]|uniref:spore germination protein n=1 Tax=Paenibacillus sp. J22TS3 TaxID=2807192 RepID=UPI001B2412F4|nr:spore germination protein [Paenibacillus sp. J22TS3]GIP20988.1 germination protein KA [Paenibacillus sp. J22TS3]